MVEEHIQALFAVLLGKRLACALQRLPATITRPGPRDFFAPQLQCGSMDDRRRFSDAVALAHVNGVCVSIPNQLDGCERMIPTKIHSTDTRPMAGELPLLDRQHLIGNWEDTARAQRRNALSPRLALMRRVRRGNLGFFLRAVMVNVIE